MVVWRIELGVGLGQGGGVWEGDSQEAIGRVWERDDTSVDQHQQ